MKIGKYKTLLIFSQFLAIWAFPVLSHEEECKGIPIFKRHISLNSCDLEKSIDDTLNDLDGVKITSFSYRYCDVERALRMCGVMLIKGMHLNAVKRKFRCAVKLVPHKVQYEGSKEDHIRIEVDDCQNRLMTTNKMQFHYPVHSIADGWLPKSILH